MNLKQIALTIGLMGGGLTGAYINWNYFPQNTDLERDIARPLATLAIGLAGIIGGHKVLKNANSSNSNPANQNSPTNSQNFPRKRRYIERRIDEYGREYRIEREETIE